MVAAEKAPKSSQALPLLMQAEAQILMGRQLGCSQTRLD